MSLGDIAQACGGELVGVDAHIIVTGVATDSRAIQPGDLFVAIVGETHDAHDFIAEALRAGAVAAVVSRSVDCPSLMVGDTVHALGLIARALLDRLSTCTVVAITGSSGKTSTKDLVAQILATSGATIAPPGSFNNEIGLPSTVLRVDESTRYLVVEMGMRGLGHISYLCDIAPPSVAVVTNVGSAHIELLGSQDAIAEAKSELVQALPDGGVAILNHDDFRVRAMRSRTGARVITYGESEGSDVRATDVSLDDLARASFTLTYGNVACPVALNVHGRHQVLNALAAAAAGLAVGLTADDVARALNEVSSASRWRMEVTRTPAGVTVINDAYNANPESMDAALHALVAMRRAGGRTWAVVGEMREIGEGSAQAHERVGESISSLGIDFVIAVGEGARPVLNGAARSDQDSQAPVAHWVDTPDAAIAVLSNQVRSGDVVLVKASRAIGLERVAVALIEAQSGKDGEL